MQFSAPGLDPFQPSRSLVENHTGSLIPSLTAISLNGFGTSYPQIQLGNPSANPIFGVTNSPILVGGTGIVTSIGQITNINTSLWSVNSLLYSSSTGILSNSPATYGDAPVAIVLKSDAVFGIIYVIALVSQFHGAYGFLNYKGTWDASTGVYPSSPSKGDYYVISVAGTISGHAYAVGDWITYDGTKWDYVDNSSYVTAVNGATGSVVVNAINQLNGDVATGVASQSQALTATIQPNVVTNAKLAQASALTIKGNSAGSTANVSDLTGTQVTAMLSAFIGDTGTGGTKGLVPAPAAGTSWQSYFLSANGSFAKVDQSKTIYPPFSLVTQTPGPAVNTKYQSVTISGTYAYLAGGGSGATMTIFDISDQTAPVLKSYLTLLGSYQIAVQGNYAYVPSSGGFVLYVVNISNPNSPSVTGSVNIGATSGSLYSCVVSGNYCYVSTQSKGLTVIDVSNPASPSQVYQEGGTTNKSFGVAISGTTLYTTNYQTASPWTVRYLKSWDVSTPTAPALLNTYTLPANTKPGNLSLSGNTAYVSDINLSRIHVIDITTPTSPSFLSTITPSGTFGADFEGVTALPNDNYLYIPSGSLNPQGGAIDFYDVSSRTSPIKLATVYTNVASSVFGGIALSGGYIFAADYGVAPGSTGTLDVFTMPTENVISGSFNYSPSTPANWSGAAPTTVKAALDRMAALLVTLNSGNPIP